MRFIRNLSIRSQLLLSVSMVHTVLVVALMLSIVGREEQFLWKRARERALHISDLVAASALPQLAINDLAALKDIVGSAKNDPATRFIGVTDSSGRILDHTDTTLRGRYMVDPAGGTAPSEATHGIVAESEDLIEAAAPVALDGNVIG